MTLEQALLIAIGGLTGVVGVLFSLYRQQFDAIAKRINDCEADRRELWKQIASLQREAQPIPGASKT